ncbi:MAG: hypothetical protein LQ340_007964, partial [Diploschistes diacapsis]
PEIPSPPALVVHGTKATGKSLTVSEVLNGLNIPHAIIRSRECITGRHLLERTVLACKHEVEKGGLIAFNDIDGRCESLSSLSVILSRLLAHTKKFVLVFDGVDKQREAPPTLLPALARLGEIIPSLTVLPIIAYPRHGSLSAPGTPHVHFPPYTRNESLAIVALGTPSIFSAEQVAAMAPQRLLETEEDNTWLWSRFTGAVWDSLGKTAARDVVTFRGVCAKLWLPFVSHIRDGTYGTRDFSRLMVRTRALFQGEDVLVSSLLAPAPASAPASTPLSSATPSTTTAQKQRPAPPSMELSYYTRYLLLAAYLASHNPPRTDQTFFSKSSERARKRRRKKNTSASAAAATTNNNNNKNNATGTPSTTARGRPAKYRKLSRRLLGPQPFGLERWLAVFHAIVPDGAPGGAADVLTQVASLGALRMVVKSGGGSAGAAGDALGEAGRWRVNVGWEFVQQVAKGLRFEMADFLAE